MFSMKTTPAACQNVYTHLIIISKVFLLHKRLTFVTFGAVPSKFIETAKVPLKENLNV